MDQGDKGPGYSLRVALLIFVTALMFSIVTAGTYLGATRFADYLSSQLQVQSHDTAVALAVALSSVDSDGAAERIIDAVFDSGAYRRVELRGPEGEPLHSRIREDASAGVPGWFAAWAGLPEAQGHAAVVSGWRTTGQVVVTGDHGPALASLWRSFITDLLWLCAVVVITVWVLWRGTGRLLRPLGHVEQQALALESGDFTARSPVPGMRELGPVVRAMNRMAAQLSETFSRQVRLIDELRRQVSQDPVTGLNNRQTFERQFSIILYSREEAGSGVLAIFRLRDFADFNSAKGRPVANKVLHECAELIRGFEADHSGVISGRGTGAEIIVFIPHADPADADQWVMELVHEMAHRYSAHAVPSTGVVQAGLTLAEPSIELGATLARADRALQAGAAGGESVVVWGHELSAAPSDSSEWRARLDAALDGDGVALAWQPVYTPAGEALLDQVLARLEFHGEWVSAARFVPSLERYGLTPTLDREVLERVLSLLERYPGAQFAVALGQASLADDGFMHWLGLRIEHLGSAADGLWLSFPERAVRALPEAVAALGDLAASTGVRLMVDQFGTGGVSFDYLARLNLQAVRIGQHYVRDVHQREDARFFLETMVPVIQQQGIRVFVSGVEVASEWEVVQRLKVDGIMGFHLARPRNRPLVEHG